MSDLSERFLKGLLSYGLTYEDIIESGWKYAGGDRGRHLNYYNLMFNGYEKIPYEGRCICGHPIKENCYITDANQESYIVLGNCCIKRFIPKSCRTCDICEGPHKNRKINRCNNCRNKYGDRTCDICKGGHRNKYVNKCNQCRLGHCDVCHKKIQTCYRKCYNCYKSS